MSSSFSWDSYFDDVCKSGPRWMDYSNERVHLQTLGAVIDASDRVRGARCLDIGCGRGQLCRMLDALGAANVVGVDRVVSAVAALRDETPHIDWQVADVSDPATRAGLGRFDRIYLLEVLQYLPVPKVFDDLWEMLAPGGRVVAVFPNEECPIVKRTVERFGGAYTPPPLRALGEWLAAAPDLDTFAARGFLFQSDQRLVPYALLPWSSRLGGPETPNRIQLVVQKRGG